MVPSEPNTPKKSVNNSNNTNADKKKRRKSKQKKRKSSIPTTTVSQTQLGPSVLASPRQQTLMRHKLDDDSDKSHPVTLLKQLKRHTPPQEVEPDISMPDIAHKLTLFKYKTGTIIQFLDQIKHNSSGTLLAQGEIEIFQLHNGDVTYLSCGKSFIYPLLPKIKILRASFNQFIIPLVNPERYWRLSVTTEETNVVDLLETTFEKYAQYRNLYVSGQRSISPQTLVQASQLTPVQAKSHFTLDDTIPESPPSAPISPRQEAISPPRFALHDPIPSHLIHHPTPRVNPSYNPFHPPIPQDNNIDNKSDLDSLLDEYEQTLEATTRANSIVHEGRSRRSSISELYTQESGWMEPTPAPAPQRTTAPVTRGIPKSRSIYSMNSYRSYDLNHIYNTVRHGNQEREELKSAKSMSKLPHDYQTRLSSRRSSAIAHPLVPSAPVAPTSATTQLNSKEIFNMLSSKPTPPRTTSFAARLFGWG
ncbi:uncharacterized protein SPAPADRAFT_52913 [Spathaspora passalidarum NRRL Y-27907]|uniref:Inheritance of peroxisomes protein 1 n=1 Tax=Spathaspora passalidarum (strain NRRL Y-27907 / 11-Y1) TaxID=619300 RepID=G3AV04_SPAPN|nr:uncharacterized protein SPAPADRAFT_52913 [Spathaspora passalidarum NRRL Y-27907]EGW30078.1 hypothetical protein SPAPADRAFT_52913 [Spathaspora passalidarum NRRL Y-27907]